MTTRRETRQPKWLLIVLLNCGLRNFCRATSFENKTETKSSPRIFSPRMDYDEWTPLGRGDPLKNDPTFDYVPPILDRVQYWMDSQTTESPVSKSDILVLGVTAKKTSLKIPEQYIKYAIHPNAPKFMRNQEVQSPYTSDFTGSRGAEPPSVLRKTNFRNVPKDYRNQDRIESIPASYYPSSYYNENPKPETFMLPPPPIARNPDRSHQTNKNHLYADKYRFGTQTEAGPVNQMKYQTYDHPKTYSQQQKPNRVNYNNQVTYDRQKLTTKEIDIDNGNHESTTSSVSFEKSNLVYQSSSHSIGSGWFGKARNPSQSASTVPSNNREYQYEEDVHQAAGSSHHQVVLGPNANIIVEPETIEDEIVIGHQESSYEPTKDEQEEPELVTAPETMVTENMYIVLANSSPSPDTKEESVTLVMPESVMVGSNSTEEDETPTKTQKGAGSKLEVLTQSSQRVNVSPHRHKEQMPQRLVGELQTSSQNAFYHQQTSHLRPAMNPHPSTNLEPMKPNMRTSTISQANIKPSSLSKDNIERHQSASSNNAIRDLLLKHDSQISPEIIESTQSTKNKIHVTTTEIPTTTSPTLTTDPIFSHYKQPANPLRGPMYLIIQGHSKVKTYKPWIDKRSNEIENIESTTFKNLSDFENFVKKNTLKMDISKDYSEDMKTTERTIERITRQDSLLSLIDSGLGSFLSSSASDSL